MAITPKQIIGTAVSLGRGAVNLLRRGGTSERPTTPATPAVTPSPATARRPTPGPPETVGAPKPRTPREFLGSARAAALGQDDRGILELTDAGRRYIRAGSAEQPFAVAPAQAEVLRALLRERQASSGVYHRLAVALRDGVDAAHLTLLHEMELIREDGTLTEAGERMVAESG